MIQDLVVIDRLYERVTSAILEAERAEAAGDAMSAQYAYLEVSFLEEDIAERIEAIDPEGAIARRGAVTAAISAEQYERALDVLHKFLEEELPPTLRERLRELEPNASSRAANPQWGNIEVRPAARFILADSLGA